MNRRSWEPTTDRERPIAVRAFALLVLVGLLLAGCGDDDEPVAAGGGLELAGEYRSVDVTEDGAPRPLVDGTTIALRFEDGQLGAHAGCNHLGADHELDGDTLVVGLMGGTEMGCPPELHEQDQWLSEFLMSSPTVSASTDGFTLTSGTTSIRFVERAVADPDVELEGTTWVVTGFVDGGGADGTASSTTGGAEASARFERDGTVRVDDGCNELTWRYEVEGGTIRFEPGIGTDVGCEAADDQRRIRALFDAGTASLDIEARNLTLLAPDGRGVTFTAGN